MFYPSRFKETLYAVAISLIISIEIAQINLTFSSANIESDRSINDE